MRPPVAGVWGLPEKWVSPSETWSAPQADAGKWFGYWPCVWNGDIDRHRCAITHDFGFLRLPSWGYAYDISYDGQRWGQRVLLWHGRKGFRLGWYFPLESPISVTPDTSGLGECR